MTNWERQAGGLPYLTDGKMHRKAIKTRILLWIYNMGIPYNMPKAFMIYRYIGIKQKDMWAYFEQPFHCVYGNHISVGKKFYANVGCTILDNAQVTIGDNAFIAPHVSIYTAGHPLHPKARNTRYEYGLPVTIGDNVWIGGNSVICPGVTIGNNVVIGAGSVVNKDIPDGVLAAGNPCRVIRPISDDEIDCYYRDRKFEPELAKKLKLF